VNANRNFGTGFFVHQEIRSTVQQVTFINDKTRHILMVSICMHQTRIKMMKSKDSSYDDLQCVFDQFVEV
jgi:hypothetical protein